MAGLLADPPACNTGGIVEKLDVVGLGIHDLHLVWDYSESPTLGRVLALPYVVRPYGRQLGEAGGFGEWQHALGHYATFSERTHRLKVQLKPHAEGALIAPLEAGGFVESFLRGLAVRGLEPYSEPVVRRVDVAVDVRCRPDVGRAIIDGLAAARVPGGCRVEAAGDPRSTVYVRPRQGRGVLSRTYCRNLKTGRGEAYGLIRFEAQWMFEVSKGFPFATLEQPDALRRLWLSRFGHEQVGATVRRIGREVQTLRLAELVRSGELTYAQMERLGTFLDLERVGLARETYPPSIYAQRRREAQKLGLAKSDDGEPVLEVELSELLAPARAAWDG